jgi:hypothetical protein
MLRLARAAASGRRHCVKRYHPALLLAMLVAPLLLIACDEEDPDAAATPTVQITVSIASIVADDHQTAVHLAFETNPRPEP